MATPAPGPAEAETEALAARRLAPAAPSCSVLRPATPGSRWAVEAAWWTCLFIHDALCCRGAVVLVGGKASKDFGGPEPIFVGRKFPLSHHLSVSDPGNCQTVFQLVPQQETTARYLPRRRPQPNGGPAFSRGEGGTREGRGKGAQFRQFGLPPPFPSHGARGVSWYLTARETTLVQADRKP